MHLYARRLFSQFAVSVAVGSNYSFVALFNDSTIGHILRLRSWSVIPNASMVVLGFLNQGSLGSLSAAGQGVFAGEGQGAGSLYTGSNTTQPTTGQAMGNATAGFQWTLDLPFAYLRPQWAFVIQGRLVNTQLSASILWEDLEPSMLESYELL